MESEGFNVLRTIMQSKDYDENILFSMAIHSFKSKCLSLSLECFKSIFSSSSPMNLKISQAYVSLLMNEEVLIEPSVKLYQIEEVFKKSKNMLT